MLGRTWRMLVWPGEVPRARCGAGGVPNLMVWPLVKVKTPGTAAGMTAGMGCRGVRERVGEGGSCGREG